MPAEAELLCDYYMASHLKGAKKSLNNSSLSDSMLSLASSASSTSSSLMNETIDFVKYDKNPMDYLKTKYPVLNNSNQPQIKKEIPTTNGVHNHNTTTNKIKSCEETTTTKQLNQIETNWSKIKKTGVGLLNIGNNCYLNATLQCLAYTPPLSQWLVSRPHSQSCRFKQAKGFCSLCEVEKIIYDIFNSCNGCVKPNTLCFNIKKISNVFGVGRQEDASEFFTTLLESMNKTISFLNSPNAKLNHNGLSNNKAKNSNINRQRSILDEIFSFQFRSRVTCCNCGRLSDTIENTNTWPVDVKYVKDLQKGMLHFLREEVLDGENAYKCDKCNKKTRATKKYSIRTTPNILVVHLKRFDFSHAGKLSHFVTYPETLSLKTLISDTPHILNGAHGSATATSSNNDIKNSTYKLYGVLVHLGYTCKSGHYYSYVRGPNNAWYKADDTRVCSVQEKDALGQNAYILFYKRMTPSLKQPETNNLVQPVQISKPIVTVNQQIKPQSIETNNKPIVSTSEQFTSLATNIVKSINSINTNAIKVVDEATTSTTSETNDLNAKILKKERLITKLSKKLKKKELKRLQKKLIRIEQKKSSTNTIPTIDSSKQTFIKKKRELRLIRKLISKRKVKRLNNGDLNKSSNPQNDDQNIDTTLPTPSSKPLTNGTDHTNHMNGKKETEVNKPFDLNELTTNKMSLVKTWNNEESNLLKIEKNRFENLTDEELDDYNAEFDMPKIKEKKLKIKNGFHKAMHHKNGLNNGNGHFKGNQKPFMMNFKKQNGQNGHNGHNHHNHQNGSYNYNNKKHK